MPKNINLINSICKNRVKPSLIRDVKTEALLVFARTALERAFSKIKRDNKFPLKGNISELNRIYEDLSELTQKLIDSVVNSKFLHDLVHQSKFNPSLKEFLKLEEPLITYYEAIAKRIEYHSKDNKILPEFIVLCTLSHWLIEEGKPSFMYPYLKKYDYLNLISLFEKNAKNDESFNKGQILKMHKISFDLVETLKKSKFKLNKQRNIKKRRNLHK